MRLRKKTSVTTAGKWACGFAFLVVLACAPAPGRTAEPVHGGLLLHRALEQAALCPGDLSLPPFTHGDARETLLFGRWMAHPLKAPLEGQHRADRLLSLASKPHEWLAALPLLQGRAALPAHSAPAPGSWDLPGRLSPRALKAVSLVLDAVAAAEESLHRAFARITPEDLRRMDRQLFPEAMTPSPEEEARADLFCAEDVQKALCAADRVDMDSVLLAGANVIRAAWQAARILARDERFLSIRKSFSVDTVLGRIRIGSCVPDVYDDGPFLLIVDPGGDDLYRGRTASAGEETCSIVLDLGGNDVYLGEDRTQGTGYRGIGLLLDLAGDDLYRARDGAQGAAVLGVGLLVDVQGSDQYLGGRFVQAAATWGYGGLIDLAGDDLYRCMSQGQAYTWLPGVACLSDACGSDRYLSGTGDPDPREPDMSQSFAQGFAMGWRNLCPGGTALLAEGSGNDVYQAQYFAQGASYWKGTGMVYDREGRDTYAARRYAQGAGIHTSLGMLLDVQGDDSTTSWGVSQGCGHDWGLGILVNESGNDTYAGDWLCMGASEANGIGLFVDNRGRDGYETRAGAGAGRLIPMRRSGGLGLFLDAAGRDRYSEKGSNDLIWARNRWAVGADAEAAGISGLNLSPDEALTPCGEDPAERQRKEEKERLEKILRHADDPASGRAVAALLEVASHWGHEKALPEEARKRLLALNPGLSLPVLTDRLDTPDIMEVLTMDEVFRVHAYHALPRLEKRAGVPPPGVRIRALRALEMLRDTRTLDTCLLGLEAEETGVRAAAARAVGNILEQKRIQTLASLLKAFDLAQEEGTPDAVRDFLLKDDFVNPGLSVAARALALDYGTYERISRADTDPARDAALDGCSRLLFENREAIRDLVGRWLQDLRGPDEAIRAIRPLLKDSEPAVRGNAAYALGQLGDEFSLEVMTGLLKDDDSRVRDAAALALAIFEDRAVDAVRRAMERSDDRMRVIGLDVLSRMDTCRSRAAAARYLEDPAPAVRDAAERALGIH